MFEKFVQGKIKYENDIVQNLTEISRESIIKSKLSEFTKNFVLADFNGSVDRDTLLAKVEKSNKLYFNFTLRPKWTLLTFLFNNFESRPPREILKKLETFPFYKFYADSIRDFLNDNIQIFTTKNEITSLIDDTNKAIYIKLTTDITNQKIKNFFLQLFLLRYDDESKYNLESTIPYSFIKIFFLDKNYNDLEKKFHTINNLSDESEVSLKDIIKVLTNKFSQDERKEVQKTEPLKPLKAEPEKNIVIPQVSEISEEEKIEPKSIYSEALVKASAEDRPLEVDVINDDSRFKNFKGLFGEHLTSRILAKVYSSDLIYMDRSFEKLNNYKTWFEASKHLKEIFQANRVEIYDKDIIKFVDVLNEYFKRTE